MSVSPRPLARDTRPSCSRQTGLEKEAEKSEKVTSRSLGPGRGENPFGRLARELDHRSGLRLQRVFWPEFHLLLRPDREPVRRRAGQQLVSQPRTGWRSGRPAGCGLRRGLLSSVTHLMTRRFARVAHGHAPRSGTPWISGWRGVIEPQTACLAVVPTVRSQFPWVKGQAQPPGACSGWGVRPAAGKDPPRVCSHQASAQGTSPVP